MIDNIYNSLIELSSLELQRMLWLNENNNTGHISSYSELMCSLFDDFNFDDFVEIGAKNNGLSMSLIIELRELRRLLINYNEKEMDELIINDPNWQTIVEQGKIVMKKWNNQRE